MNVNLIVIYVLSLRLQQIYTIQYNYSFLHI